MRRNPEIERQILLGIEAEESDATLDLSAIDAPEDALHYHLRLLDEAGLILAADAATLENRFAMIPIRLTMAGHEYLDTIRDDEVWQRTQEGANAVGSFSLAVLGALAKGFIREKIRKHTGMEVDL